MENIKVLAVDDETDFLDPMLKRLKLRNFIVYSADNGYTAIEMVNEKEIDVVLLDVRMPGINGLETLAEIKQIDPGIQIIMVTGHANIEVAVEGMKKGVFDYLLKPIDMEELVVKIQDAYQEGRLHRLYEKSHAAHNGGTSNGGF